MIALYTDSIYIERTQYGVILVFSQEDTGGKSQIIFRAGMSKQCLEALREVLNKDDQEKELIEK